MKKLILTIIVFLILTLIVIASDQRLVLPDDNIIYGNVVERDGAKVVFLSRDGIRWVFGEEFFDQVQAYRPGDYTRQILDYDIKLNNGDLYKGNRLENFDDNISLGNESFFWSVLARDNDGDIDYVRNIGSFSIDLSPDIYINPNSFNISPARNGKNTSIIYNKGDLLPVKAPYDSLDVVVGEDFVHQHKIHFTKLSGKTFIEPIDEVIEYNDFLTGQYRQYHVLDTMQFVMEDYIEKEFYDDFSHSMDEMLLVNRNNPVFQKVIKRTYSLEHNASKESAKLIEVDDYNSFWIKRTKTYSWADSVSVEIPVDFYIDVENVKRGELESVLNFAPYEDIRVLVRVENRGLNLAENFLVSLYSKDDILLDEKMIKTLPPGRQQIVDFVWQPKETGQYSLYVEADRKQKLEEDNRNNNMAEFSSINVMAPINSATIYSSPETIYVHEIAYSQVEKPKSRYIFFDEGSILNSDYYDYIDELTDIINRTGNKLVLRAYNNNSYFMDNLLLHKRQFAITDRMEFAGLESISLVEPAELDKDYHRMDSKDFDNIVDIYAQVANENSCVLLDGLNTGYFHDERIAVDAPYHTDKNLILPFEIFSVNGIKEWKLIITSEDNKIINSYTNDDFIGAKHVLSEFAWDFLDKYGKLVKPDKLYCFLIEIKDIYGNNYQSKSRFINIKQKDKYLYRKVFLYEDFTEYNKKLGYDDIFAGILDLLRTNYDAKVQVTAYMDRMPEYFKYGNYILKETYDITQSLIEYLYGYGMTDRVYLNSLPVYDSPLKVNGRETINFAPARKNMMRRIEVVVFE